METTRSKEVNERNLGLEHPDVLSVVNNLASVLCNMERYLEAEPLYRRCLEVRERTLGSLVGGLSGFYSLHALKMGSSLVHPHGIDRHISIRFGWSIFPKLGCWFQHLQWLYFPSTLDPPATLWLFPKKISSGKEHPDTLASIHNLAALMTSQGRHWEAQRCYRSCLPAMDRILGPEHPTTLAAVNNLATVPGLRSYVYIYICIYICI